MGADIPQGQRWPACQVTKWQIQGEAVPLGECTSWQRLGSAVNSEVSSAVGAWYVCHQCTWPGGLSPQCTGLQDTWRTVTVDDRIPLDLFGKQFKCSAEGLQQQVQHQQQDCSSSQR